MARGMRKRKFYLFFTLFRKFPSLGARDAGFSLAWLGIGLDLFRRSHHFLQCEDSY